MTTEMTEAARRDAGLWYDANYDPELLAQRMRSDELTFDFNRLRPSDGEGRERILRELFGSMGERVAILGPIQVDYGYNVHIGSDVFVNHGAYLMDCAPITIGDHAFIGPNLGAYTAQHPLVAEERNRGLERALPIAIGANTWLGGDVKIMPGVTIGEGSVIGAGSVVTRDIPAGVVAVGNPCRVLRPITERDRIAR